MRGRARVNGRECAGRFVGAQASVADGTCMKSQSCARGVRARARAAASRRLTVSARPSSRKAMSMQTEEAITSRTSLVM
eukprot:3918134-Pleurochrysis_carterae.AAC.2